MSYTIRPFTADDYEQTVAVKNVCWPDFPSTPDEWRHWDAHRDPKCQCIRLVAERDGMIVGFTHAMHQPWMYHPQKFFANVSVLPEQRRQGIGGALYAALLDAIAPFEPLALRGEAREDWADSLRFLHRLGFREETRSWESRLDLATFDPAPYAEVERQVAAHGIVIRTWRELQSDPDRNRKLYDLVTDVDRDVPSPDEITAVDFDSFVRGSIDHPNLLPDALLIALDGDEYVGLSQLWSSQASPTVDNGMTGVKRSHRRKGIALAMKVRNAIWAQQQGYPMIKTFNDSTNRPMLSINEMLGFQKQPAWINLVNVLGDETYATADTALQAG
jgi:GNAT superfamily N-acetyltransferase